MHDWQYGTFDMNKFIRALRYSAAGLVAIFVFFGWVNLVFPQIHTVETVITLALMLASGKIIYFQCSEDGLKVAIGLHSGPRLIDTETLLELSVLRVSYSLKL